MSISDIASLSHIELLGELTLRCSQILDDNSLDDLPDESLAQALCALVRLLAAKAQAGSTPNLSAGNHQMTATDGVIACTAILESINVEVFELSAWQALSNVGSRRKAKSGSIGEAQ